MRSLAVVIAVVALLAGMAAAMVTTAVEQTPTIDEPVYVGASVLYLREHDLRDNPEHPPLGKLAIGIGPEAAGVHLDRSYTGPQEAIGRHLLYESGNDPDEVMLAARLPVIALTLLFGLVVFAFARDLAGPGGGLLALGLYAFSPDVIAHGSLATLDVPAAGFVLTAAWLLWRARDRPRLYVPLAGVVLGAALATKMNTLAAVPVLLVLAAVPAWSAARTRDDAPRGKAILRGALAAAGVAAIAIAVVWASYLAVDPRLRWTTPPDVPSIGGLRGALADLAPFPRPYRDGLRIQFGFEDATWTGFLFGRHYQGSLWYYLPAALLVKTPLGMLALWLAGAAALLSVRRLRPAVPYVLAPAALLLAAAMAGSRDLGVRYAIFVPLFLAVAAGCAVAVRWRWTPVAAAALALFVAASSVRAFPYYLPYSNEAFGGPSKTHLRLHDSNVDWGQDLGRLADRLRDRYAGQRIWLAYKGSGVPAGYGIRASDPLAVPPDRVAGILAVSDSWIDKGDPRVLALVRTSEPIDEVGHSITIYRRPAPARQSSGQGQD